MKKSKPDYFFGVICGFIELMIIIPIICVVMGLVVENVTFIEAVLGLSTDSLNNQLGNFTFIEAVLGGVVCFFGTNLALIGMDIIIFLISYPFVKYSVFLDDDSITYQNRCVRYDDIISVKIDRGVSAGRYKGWQVKPQLRLINKNTDTVSIKNPSIFLIFTLIKRCKNAKVRYVRLKEAKKMILITLAILIIVVCIAFIYSMF